MRWAHSVWVLQNALPFNILKTSPEVISLAVMLHVRFPLSLRNIKDLLHERKVEVSHETVRYWWNRFSPLFAFEIRKRRVNRIKASSNWQWHLNEVFVKVNSVRYYIWRGVDHEGEVLESFATRRRDRKAALKFLNPKRIVTDRLRSYGAAMKITGNSQKQRTGRYMNNRVENSHLPFRRRERAMLRFSNRECKD